MNSARGGADTGGHRPPGDPAEPGHPGRDADADADGRPLAGWRLGTLRGRLLWSMVLVLVLALGGLGLRTASDASQRLQNEESARARALARSVALTIVNPMLTQQLDQIEESLLRLALMPGLRELRVADAAGRVIGHVVATPGGEPVARFDQQPPLQVPGEPRPKVIERRTTDGAPEFVAWHPIGEPRPVGWVQVVQSQDALVSLQREVVVRTVVTAAAAALLGCIGLLWLLRAPLAALRAAGRFALQLRRVDGAQLALDARAPLETRALVTSLNTASTRLAGQAREIRQALADLRRQGDALDQRNRELDAILSISPSGLLALDAHDRVCFASAALGRFTGLDPQALIGQPLQQVECWLREQAGAAPDWPGFGAAWPAPGDDEGAAPLLVLERPVHRELRLERGRVDAAGIVWLISAQDVTHEREVERLKSEFLSTAAHELRTPMVSIHGFTELLLHRRLPAERQHTMLEAVHRNSVLMNHIINELLDLARIEARRGADFERVPLDLAQLVRDAVADFRPPDGRDAPQVLDLGAPAPAWGDRGKLRQVLFNLLSNAYKYSTAPSEVTVRLLCDDGDGDDANARVGLAVTDRGIGMTPEQTARVFERFYRADPSGTVLGTGLGMSIVREIVQLHGGQVALDSQPGEGTTATVWLPRHQGAADDGAPAQPADAELALT